MKMNALTKGFQRMSIQVKKDSPEILMALDLIASGAALFFSHRAGRKVDEVVTRSEKQMHVVKRKMRNAKSDKEYSDLQRKKIRIVADTAKDLCGLYGPVIGMEAVSLACRCKYVSVMNNRYIGTVAIANSAIDILNSYRKNVRDELGEEADYHFRYGTKKETVKETVTEEDGEEKEVEKEVEKVDYQIKPGEFARYFDGDNDQWDPNPSFNLCFLNGQEQMANDMLVANGHLFVNEVYDMLGYPRTPEGAVAGWLAKDGKVDFGLYNYRNPETRRFINGRENVVLLDFNVQGIIWDKI